jgi:hypothetical protein
VRWVSGDTADLEVPATVGGPAIPGTSFCPNIKTTPVSYERATDPPCGAWVVLGMMPDGTGRSRWA